MEVILSTLLGGALALGGAWIGPHFQRKHERWKARREDETLLRSKAQEVFDELDRLVLDSQKAMLASLARLQDGAAEAVAVPDLGRIRAVAAIYFPSSLALIEAFEAQQKQITQVVTDEARKAIQDGAKGIGTLKGLPMIMTSKYQECAVSFANNMRSHFAENVPKLDLGGKE